MKHVKVIRSGVSVPAVGVAGSPTDSSAALDEGSPVSEAASPLLGNRIDGGAQV